MTRFVNSTKSALLMGAMFGLLMGACYLMGGGTGMMTIAFLFAGVGNFIAYFYSDKLALKAMRGQQVDRQSAPDLIEMVERLARNARLPMPKVYICPQDAPNAFATGRNPQHAAVAVTHGAMRLLNYDELEGVIAHELAHIKNRDTLTSTIAATLAGAISYLGWIFMFGGGRRDVHPAILLLMIILAPLAAMIIQMAISRSREFVADSDGAEIAGTPHGLISALRKLDSAARKIPMQNSMPSQNHMFIVQPFSAGQSFAKLFSSHPRTEKRIEKLQKLG